MCKLRKEIQETHGLGDDDFSLIGKKTTFTKQQFHQME